MATRHRENKLKRGRCWYISLANKLLNMNPNENCKEAVFNYLKTQNRPYSANDIIQNLHKEFGKSAIQKTLDDLTFECKIKEKIYGKQKVYVAAQDNEMDVTDEALSQMELEIGEKTENLKISELELKNGEAALKELEKEPTTEAAFEERRSLREEIGVLKEKINAFSTSSFKETGEDRKKIIEDRERFTKEYKKRKRMCMDIINSILENYPKKMKGLIDEIGIEVDDGSLTQSP